MKNVRRFWIMRASQQLSEEEFMARTAVIDHRTLGALVLERLQEVGVPKGLAPHASSFKAAHLGFEKAAVAADVARAKRDAALAAIGMADVGLDASLDPLADKMIGAGLGTRKSAFGGASPYSPTRLKELPYKTEVTAVRTLVAAVTSKKPPADVAKCLAACSKAADASEVALAGLTKPQAAYDRALGSRDALLIEWIRTFSRLRIHAKAAWIDDKAAYASVFAAPERVQRPVKKRKKAAAKAPATPPT